jgi:hypothetical protein
MVKTPAKLANWTFDISNSQFGSPYSDASVSSTSSLQYINSQLVAHGFAHGSGLSLDGLERADMDRVVKCLIGMLGQRVVSTRVLLALRVMLLNWVAQDDMSRAEELSTKLRTLSYEHERLMTMQRTAKEAAANAERESNLQKSRATWVLPVLCGPRFLMHKQRFWSRSSTSGNCS